MFEWKREQCLSKSSLLPRFHVQSQRILGMLCSRFSCWVRLLTPGIVLLQTTTVQYTSVLTDEKILTVTTLWKLEYFLIYLTTLLCSILIFHNTFQWFPFLTEIFVFEWPFVESYFTKPLRQITDKTAFASLWITSIHEKFHKYQFKYNYINEKFTQISR